MARFWTPSNLRKTIIKLDRPKAKWLHPNKLVSKLWLGISKEKV